MNTSTLKKLRRTGFNFKKILLTAILAVSMLNVSAFGGKYKKQYPLHYAVSKHNCSKVIELCQSVNFDSAYINMQDDKGKTPLHKAVEIKRNGSSYSHLDIPKILGYLIFTANADVNVKDYKGNTPLFYAFNAPSCSKTASSLFLLMGGASIDVVNNEGKNLWQAYFEKNKTLCYSNAVFHFEVVSLLFFDSQNINLYKLGLSKLGLWNKLLMFDDKENQIKDKFEEAFNADIVFDKIKQVVCDLFNIDAFTFDFFIETRNECLNK